MTVKRGKDEQSPASEGGAFELRRKAVSDVAPTTERSSIEPTLGPTTARSSIEPSATPAPVPRVSGVVLRERSSPPATLDAPAARLSALAPQTFGSESRSPDAVRPGALGYAPVPDRPRVISRPAVPPPSSERMPASADDFSGPPATQAHPHPLDASLLELLHDAFTDHAGPESRLDAAELQRSLEIKNPFLAERMLAVFDQNSDGVITRAEFLDRVRRLVFGSTSDKLRFAFRIHDLDADNVITRPELLRMITLCMAEEKTLLSPRAAEAMTDVLLKAADHNQDGRLTYREFEAVVGRYPKVLDLITRSEASWLAPNEDLLDRFQEPVSKRKRLKRALQNRLLPTALLSLWIIVNVALFVLAALRYRDQGANGFVMLARGAGAALNFNGALILIPVMRRLLTRMRRTPLLRKLPVDDAITFHRLVGQTMFGLALLHTAAHLANYARAGRGIVPGVFGSAAGLTGFFLLLAFGVMWWFSRPAVRRSGKFELFYFSHLLYIAWFALLLAHGPVFYLWAGVPLLGFAVEQLLRVSKSTERTRIHGATPLRSGVTRLDIARPEGFRHRAGDYLFIRIPTLARREWHPFTISSAPERERISLHVRSLGNFTGALRELAEKRNRDGNTEPLEAYLDGPYGTASAHIFEAQNAVMIGAGIGVTPFASVLESIVLRANEGATKLKKVHFFWINRDAYSFEWFAQLLLRLEEIDKARLVDIHMCMTDGRGHVTSACLNLAREISHELGNPDLITGLRSKTKLGRPDFRAELRAIVDQHSPEPVEVFFCGPPGLARKIERFSSELGLRFRQEHF
jgi:predicted ferric reductase/Ca2+-binding EF-hand superfamily protein